MDNDTTSPKNRQPLRLNERWLITAPEVAALLGCCHDTVKHMNRHELMPQSIRLGPRDGMVRWRVAELFDWVAASCPPRRHWRWQRVELPKLDELVQRQRHELSQLSQATKEAEQELYELRQQIKAEADALQDIRRWAAAAAR